MGVLHSLRRRGYSVTQLCKENGLNAKHMRNAIHGRSPFTHDELIVVCEALGVSASELPRDVLERALLAGVG